MLRDPAILILDEATSAVDIQDELLIRKAIEEFAKDRTTFLISHNLASIQVADRIALLNGGRIEAVGTDHELKRTSALYRRLHEIHYHVEPSQRPARPHTRPATGALDQIAAYVRPLGMTPSCRLGRRLPDNSSRFPDSACLSSKAL